MGVDVRGCLGIKFINLCYKSCVGLYNTGNGREIIVHSEPTIGDFLGIVTEGFTIPENSVHEIIFLK